MFDSKQWHAVVLGTALIATGNIAEARNHAPTITGIPATRVTAGKAYGFTPTAKGADGNTLQFSVSNKPSWATFSTATGRLSGTPTNAQAGAPTG